MFKIFLLSIFAFSAFAKTPLDRELEQIIERLKLKPLKELSVKNPYLFKAGKRLFSDKILSGNKNISCLDCHDPQKGTSDAIALSLGEGSSKNSRGERIQARGKVIRRNSPALFNLGYSEFDRLLWDGRVSYNGYVFKTPEKRLNGSKPEGYFITKHFDHVLDAQALFPLLSHDEMRGSPGSNELADLEDNFKVWRRLFKRVKFKRPETYKLLKKAYPHLSEDEFNIAHVANALSEFIKNEFQVNDTPFDRYLGGELKAMSEKSKRGFKLFTSKGKCVLCHNGDHLTNQLFRNVGTPPLYSEGMAHDYGRGEVVDDDLENFNFKTPPLRNIAKSAPYMHNGVFSTLEEVVDHYNDIPLSLYSFNPKDEIHIPYHSDLIRYRGELLEKIEKKLSFRFILQRGLQLTPKEKSDLVTFLKFGLSSP